MLAIPLEQNRFTKVPTVDPHIEFSGRRPMNIQADVAGWWDIELLIFERETERSCKT